MFTAKKVEKYLKSHGYRSAKAVESQEPLVEDDDVEITPLVSVQVGDCYLSVTRQEGDKFYCYPIKERLANILPDLQDALSKSGEA